jgi:hypothetical protein
MWVFYENQNDGNPFDVRSTNRTLQQLSDTSTRFDEPAWAANWITEAGMSDNIAIRAWRGGFVGPVMGTGADIKHSSVWQSVPNTQVDLVSRGGLFWVRSNVVCSNPTQLSGATPGLEFAIEVDGSVVFESGTGSADMGLEQVSSVVGYSGSFAGLSPSYNQYGPGTRSYRDSPCTGAMLRLAAGPHTIRLVYRNVEPADDPAEQKAHQASLVVLELWA